MAVAKVFSILERVASATSRIASVRAVGDQLHVNLPLMYPSGSTVVVSVETNREHVWVSDMGFGLMEAEFHGAQENYSKSAKFYADAYGVDFDGNSVFALWVPIARIESALLCVANASQQAANEAVRSASEARTHNRNDEIFDRVTRIFGAKCVARSREISGRHAAWNVHNVVETAPDKFAVFEYMTDHPTSVSSKFLMFSDIRQANLGYSLNAVVKDVQSLDVKAQMVGDVANLVAMNATDASFQRIALAA
jgi:hypothetical protein